MKNDKEGGTEEEHKLSDFKKNKQERNTVKDLHGKHDELS